MSVTLHSTAIVEFQRALQSLRSILKKAEPAPNSSTFFDLRLAEDMLPLAFQVHFVTDVAQKSAHRLTGREPLALKRDDIVDFASSYARIDAIEKVLAETDADTVNSFATKKVTLGLGPGKNVELDGANYIAGYAFPNIFFHLTTAYAILRKEGVPLGKVDYQTPFMSPFM